MKEYDEEMNKEDGEINENEEGGYEEESVIIIFNLLRSNQIKLTRKSSRQTQQN